MITIMALLLVAFVLAIALILITVLGYALVPVAVVAGLVVVDILVFKAIFIHKKKEED